MPEPPVITISTLEDLKRVLFIQRYTTRRAHDELEAVASDKAIDSDSDPSKVANLMKEEAALLASYAMRPTLTEWNAQGGLDPCGFYATATTYGASFGVAVLIGELIFEQVRRAHPHAGGAIKGVFISLLAAETQSHLSGSEGMGGLSVMQFSVSKSDGSQIENEGAREQIQATLNDMIQTIVATGVEYGLFDEQEAHTITEVGIRVLLHMQDITKFVSTVADAHKRFQKEIPVISSNPK
jgi:hypothetical protein